MIERLLGQLDGMASAITERLDGIKEARVTLDAEEAELRGDLEAAYEILQHSKLVIAKTLGKRNSPVRMARRAS